MTPNPSSQNPDKLFEQLYSGALIQLPASPTCLELLEEARALVRSQFGPKPEELSPKEQGRALEVCRNMLSEPSFHAMSSRILEECGFEGTGLWLDKLRMRAVSPGLENVEAARAVFHCHRDTWYGNPACQVNCWLPLQAVNGENSFRFYTSYFEKAIRNDSKDFIAEQFLNEGGFGRVKASPSVYPKALDLPEGEFCDIVMDEPQLLLFAAHHLHQTLPNKTSRIRFSLDFRFFSESHRKEGRGPKEVDNKSDGLCLQDYKACV